MCFEQARRAPNLKVDASSLVVSNFLGLQVIPTPLELHATPTARHDPQIPTAASASGNIFSADEQESACTGASRAELANDETGGEAGQGLLVIGTVFNECCSISLPVCCTDRGGDAGRCDAQVKPLCLTLHA